MATLKEHVSGQVQFHYYRDGQLWYKTTNTGFSFPVPIEDIGNATFWAEDKGLLFMRYIRKHMEVREEAQKAALES